MLPDLTIGVEKVKIFGTVLEWACGLERERPITVTRKRRVALLVVEYARYKLFYFIRADIVPRDLATASARAAQLGSHSKLSLAVYTHSAHSSSMETWMDLSNKKEVVVVSSRVSFQTNL